MSEDLTVWTPFVEALCAAVDVDPATVDLDVILELTRVVAHGGARPMAPVSAFILGVASGRSPDAAALGPLSARLQDAAAAVISADGSTAG